jgi:hypothetical protein
MSVEHKNFIRRKKMRKNNISKIVTVLAFVFGIIFLGLNKVYSHCDTLNGPVVKDAKIALEKGDVTPVLKWVKKENEAEIRTAFNTALNERNESAKAKEKADMKFFETLVRIHRAGEGASFTGLKPAGSVEPIIAEADKALDTGSADKLTKEVSNEVTNGIKQRFNIALEKKKHMNENVDAGREYVEAYIKYVHYVEGLHEAALGKASHHEEAEDPIKGQVVDETGKPLEGVTWRIIGIEELRDGKWMRVHRSGEPREDTTDSEGRFVVPFRERLRYDLQFRKFGFAQAFIFEVSADSPEIRLTMKRGESIHGTVKRLIDGQLKPVPMASVELRLPSWDFWYQERVFTGPSGEFEFRACAPPSEPPLPSGNLVGGMGKQDSSRKCKWQVVYEGEVVEIDVRDGEPVEAVDFEIVVTVKKHPS